MGDEWGACLQREHRRSRDQPGPKPGAREALCLECSRNAKKDTELGHSEGKEVLEAPGGQSLETCPGLGSDVAWIRGTAEKGDK